MVSCLCLPSPAGFQVNATRCLLEPGDAQPDDHHSGTCVALHPRRLIMTCISDGSPPTTKVTIGPSSGFRGGPFVRLTGGRRDGLLTCEPGLPDCLLLKSPGDAPPPSGSSSAANAHTSALVAVGTATGRSECQGTSHGRPGDTSESSGADVSGAVRAKGVRPRQGSCASKATGRIRTAKARSSLSRCW